MDNSTDGTIGELTESVISFDPRTLRLHTLLSGKSQILADMLMGAWVTLGSSSNPDMLPQVAHSMRELIEKAPFKIPEVPIDKDDPNTRKIQVVALIRTLNGSEQLPAHILTTHLDIIWTLRDYFVAISHHNRPEVTVDEVRKAIISFEECMLNLISPEPIPELDELDALMAEGELA